MKCKLGMLIGLSALGLNVALAAPAAVTTSGAANSSTQSFATTQEKLSYTMGFATGKAFKQHDVKLSPRVFLMGLKDGIMGNSPKLDQATMTKVMGDFQQKQMQRLRTQTKQQSASNEKASVAFLAANKAKAGVKELPSGVQYKVITKGTGPQPTQTSTVTVNYEGKLVNGKVFDSSYARGKPATFKLQDVIPGWRDGLSQMHQGGTWMLYIPAKLAYGERGVPGLIGPNQVLIFKVQLLDVKNN